MPIQHLINLKLDNAYIAAGQGIAVAGFHDIQGFSVFPIVTLRKPLHTGFFVLFDPIMDVESGQAFGFGLADIHSRHGKPLPQGFKFLIDLQAFDLHQPIGFLRVLGAKALPHLGFAISGA